MTERGFFCFQNFPYPRLPLTFIFLSEQALQEKNFDPSTIEEVDGLVENVERARKMANLMEKAT